MSEIRSLQTFNEGNKIYVVIYTDHKTIIKIYERLNHRHAPTYNFIGIIEA